MENNIAYAEVFEILSCMNKQMVMKIPMEILEVIKKEKKENYISKIDKNDLFNIDNVCKQTRNILAWINFEYWATEEEKKRLKEIYVYNEKIYEENKKSEFLAKYSNKMFDNRGTLNKYNSVDSNKELFIVKENLLSKIKKFLINIFR